MLAEVTTSFQHHYEDVTFESRMEVVRRRSDGGSLRLVTAMDQGVQLGYCLSTIGRDRIGWVDSFYVRPQHRGNGIGREMMLRSIDWLHGKGAKAIRLTVTPGNEDVMGFYRAQGFELRKYLLELDVKNE